MRKLLTFLVFFVFVQLLSCATRSSPAPIENVTQIPSNLVPIDHSIDPNENQEAENANKSNSNNTVESENTGPKLGSLAQNKQVASNSVVSAKPQQITKNGAWLMPTQGNIVSQFTPSGKGVDISGTLGQPIYATKAGKVVYSGNGLKGYGNLIIIKHDGTYLSAYAHNKVNLVKDGATVKAGQKIAEMGSGDNGQPILHFEIRQNGKPLDPSTLVSN